MTALFGLAATCLLLQGMYTAAEGVLLHVDRAKLAEQSHEGQRSAQGVLALLANPERLLGTCMIGTNVFLVVGATCMVRAPQMTKFSWLPLSLYILGAVTFGDVVPRRLSRHFSAVLAGPAAALVKFSEWPFAPLLAMVRTWTRLVRPLIGAKGRTPLTRQEILDLIQVEPSTGDPLPEEHRMIQRVFAITETTASECMTPLVEVDALPADLPIAHAIAAAVRTGRTRLPVFEGRVDHIVGVVHARDLLFGVDPQAPTGSIAHPVRYVPDSKRVDALLQELRREREHFVVVVDEYGGSTGILTIEDILEELIGEIQDERDDEAGIRKVSEHEWRVPARVSLEALEQALDTTVPSGDFETVAGLVLSAVGRIPRVGEIIPIGDLSFRIEEANERAIQSVTVRRMERTPSAMPHQRPRS